MKRISFRIVVGIVTILSVLVTINVLLKSRLTILFEDHVSKQVCQHSSELSSILTSKIQFELTELSNMADIIKSDTAIAKKIINSYQKSNPQETYGLITLDGKHLHSDDTEKNINAATFSGIQNSFRGHQSISYVKDFGLLLTTPVYNNKNVRYVLFKFFNESRITALFSIQSFDGKGYALVIDETGREIIGSSYKPAIEENFWTSDKDEPIRTKLSNLLYWSKTAAVASSIQDKRYYYFVTELEIPGYKLIGKVSENAIATDLSDIIFLVLWVFSLLFLLFIIGFIYLFLSERSYQMANNLRQAKALAEKTSKTKSMFLANMSHEMRTPLNGILGMNAVLFKECNDPKIRRYSQNIRTAGQTLLSLVNGILDMSKIESGKMEILSSEYSVFTVVNDCYNLISTQASDKSLQLKVHVNPELPSRLEGDEFRIRQVINNLLSNAVKYTFKGEILFSVDFKTMGNDQSAIQRDKPIHLIISVSDTGVGIKDEDKQKLFDKFQRLDEKKMQNIEGSGLGLNLTQHLVNMMHGEIQVNSVYEKGSTFTVSIPQIIKQIRPIGEFEKRRKEEQEIIEQKNNIIQTPNAHILIADDVPMNIHVMQELLKETQINIDTASNGKMALELIAQKHYDIIFLDHMMPIMSGTEVLSKMRTTQHPNQKTPVIMLSANTATNAKEDYLRTGFTDYLSKPIHEDALYTILQLYLPSESINREEPISKKDASPKKDASSHSIARSHRKTNEIIADLDFIDTRVGINHCMNDREFFIDVLVEYVNKRKDINLQKFFDEKDWENYNSTIRNIKSSSLTIGSIMLSASAKQLESACANKDFSYIKLHHGDFMEEYQSVLDKLEQSLIKD